MMKNITDEITAFKKIEISNQVCIIYTMDKKEGNILKI